uniref:Uncharacterized protein n=1 Tax=Arundo donax TaxID=35708 RepID=A0A0A8ZHZ4_ARUDO
MSTGSRAQFRRPLAI